MQIKYSYAIRNKINITNKIQWKDELLNTINLINEKYTLKEIENHLRKTIGLEQK